MARQPSLWLALCLLKWSGAVRTSIGDNDRSRFTGGCDAQTNCGDCLRAKPTRTKRATFCKWCPQEFWAGDASAFQENATGVCRKNHKVHDSCAGGSEWVFVGNSPINRGSNRGYIAADAQEAAQWCPAEQHLPLWKVRTLNSVKARDLQDPAIFNATLHLLNLDVKRLHRLRVTAPNLYHAKFDPHSKVRAANYAWQLSTWGATFIPVVGGVVSLGLGLATSAIEAGVDFESRILSAQRTSQANMVSIGKRAVLEYFSDVTYGMLDKQSKNAGAMSKAVREAKKDAAIDGQLVQSTGTAVGDVDKAFGHIGYRLGKALVHTGLFVGGFFTFGLTWLIETALGAAEMMTEWSVAYAAAKSLDQKMFLLITLAYRLDESIWAPNGTACHITDFDAGLDPCPAIDTPRVCSRSSAWGSHRDAIPKGEFSAEGRCIPRIRQGLLAGSPCVTHEGCESGYCHFEPRLLHVFSDHHRKFCHDHEHCAEHSQLTALQLADAHASSEEMLNFTKNYKGSFHGPLFATMGTCAVPCPATLTGRGDCYKISLGPGSDHGSTAAGVAGYEFGFRRPGSVVVGYRSFRKIGRGRCGKMVDGRTDVPPRTLEPDSTIDLPTHEVIEDYVAECANKCQSHWRKCEAFTLDGKSCILHCNIADTPVDFHLAPEAGCYSAELAWPLDIYQPWNFEWRAYRLNLRRVVDKMLNDDEDNATLESVRVAYDDWCNTSDASVGGPRCRAPSTWYAQEAAHMLLELAPLSAAQMMALAEKVFPGSTELPAQPDEKIRMRDMLNRPHGFGVAWRLFFGPFTIAHITSDAPLGGDERWSMRKAWVQSIEREAVEQGMRTPEGVWDFGTVAEKKKRDRKKHKAPDLQSHAPETHVSETLGGQDPSPDRRSDAIV